MSVRHLVIGVGNRDRGDDAVGPIVCDRLTVEGAEGIEPLVLEAGGVDLLTHWDVDDRVTIVDAMQPTGRPGRLMTIDALSRPLASPAAVSTHSVDIATAIELARVLDALPASLTLIGIEGERFDFGRPLSQTVIARVDEVVRAITRHAGERVAGR